MRHHVERLKLHIQKYDLVVDRLLRADVKQQCAHDDEYFVFEELVLQILLLWSRDPTLLEKTAVRWTPPAGTTKSTFRNEIRVTR